MNERLLLEMATDLGYRLAMAGAETYRVEESITLVLRSYGLEAEAFAIPNCLIVSIITDSGKPMTRMRRIGTHGNDLDAVERYNRLSRQLCAQRPSPEEAMALLNQTQKSLRIYPASINALGYFMGSFGFCLLFGGGLADSVCAGLCGLMVLCIDLAMDRIQATQFFRVIIAAFISALPAYFAHSLGLIGNADAAIIGTLMLLVPGLLFTNAMRDVMYGDTNSGINRLVQVLLIAVAIALGTATALWITTQIWPEPMVMAVQNYDFLMLNVGCFIGCMGFSILFNIHGPGMLLCALGGVLGWSAYLITKDLTASVVFANLIGGLTAAFYAEIMARVRKYPAISYLVVSIFPLIPGAGVYYTMSYAVRNDMTMFATKGMETAAVAGAIALGILLVSTAFRLWSLWQFRNRGQYGHH